jgi:hypothetical protein
MDLRTDRGDNNHQLLTFHLYAMKNGLASAQSHILCLFFNFHCSQLAFLPITSQSFLEEVQYLVGVKHDLDFVQNAPLIL